MRRNSATDPTLATRETRETRQPSLDPATGAELDGGIPDEVSDLPIEAQPTTYLTAQPSYSPYLSQPSPVQAAAPGRAAPTTQQTRDRWRAWLLDALARAGFAWHGPEGKTRIAFRPLVRRLTEVDPQQRAPQQWQNSLTNILYKGAQPTMELAFLLARTLDMSPWALLLHSGLVTLDQVWWLAGGGAMMSRAQAESMLEASQHLPAGPVRDADLLECRRILEFYDATAEFGRYLSPDDYGAQAADRLAAELPYGLPGHTYARAGASAPLASDEERQRRQVAAQLAESAPGMAAFGGPFATRAARQGVTLPTAEDGRRAAQPGPRYQHRRQPPTHPHNGRDLADLTDDARDDLDDADALVVDADPS